MAEDFGNVLTFDKFDMKTLVYNDEGEFLNPRIAIIAKSGSGKSWVIREILYYLYKTKVPCGTVIAPTDKMTKFYNDFVPPAFIHHEYKEDIIPKLLQRQRIIIDKNEQRAKKNKPKVDPRAYLVMDDCMSSKHLWLRDPCVLSIFNEGRHFQLTFILAMQYSLGIQPELRSNFDFIFLLGEDNFSNRKKLYEHYAGIFPTRDIFEMAFSELTNNYGCMVINNRIRCTDIRKKVFHFRANKTPGFHLGVERLLRFNDENFDPEHEKRGNMFDLTTLVMKRKSNVRIKLNH
jgi:hypothetical protein